MKFKTILDKIVAPLLFGAVYFFASVTPADSAKALHKWGVLAVDFAPDWDIRVMGGTLVILCVIVACGACRSLLRLWNLAREHGVPLIPKRKPRQGRSLSPVEALREFTDKSMLVQYERRVLRVVNAQAAFDKCALDRHGIQRNLTVPGSSQAWLEAQEKLTAANGELHDATEDFDIYAKTFIRSLTEQLQRGLLIARAYVDARLLAGTEIGIQAVQWSFLELDLENESAGGRGVTYHHVRITRA